MTITNPAFRLHINEVFNLQNGKTVLAGSVEGDEEVIIQPGECMLLVNGQFRAKLNIDPELLNTPGNLWSFRKFRGVTTSDAVPIEIGEVKSHDVVLEGPMTIQRPRHLIGIDSPPDDFLPDPMTLGPRLPPGWDGDAWIAPQGQEYFLRAWNKSTAQFTIARATKYEEARAKLLNNLHHSPKHVVIQVSESVSQKS